MKVEFLESDILGVELFISASDFLKAEKNEKEYDSLVHATEAFANLFGIEYHISTDEYRTVVSCLDKNSAVIFTIGESQYPTRRWCEILISNNNQLQKIAFEDENGYHLMKRGRINPNAIAAIKKRREAEAKNHE